MLADAVKAVGFASDVSEDALPLLSAAVAFRSHRVVAHAFAFWLLWASVQAIQY